MGVVDFIQRACQKDIPEIYALMVEAFGAQYFPYTIYQSPKSVSFLNRLVSSDFEHKAYQLMVLRRGGSIQGYYQAFISAKKFFLNYIAVKRTFSGQGLGSALLTHFEHKGQNLGCRQYGLDVFERNHRALEWYSRKGYEKESDFILTRITLGIVNKPGPELNCHDKTWEAAINEEMKKGFSQLECLCGQGSIVLGLINDSTCKLLKYEGVSLEEALLSINCYFGGRERENLIVSSSCFPNSYWPLQQQDRIFRLVKDV